MAYKLRINFKMGENLAKRISDGRNEYSLTVYVDMIMLGETCGDRTFWVNDGDHVLKVMFNDLNVREKYRTSVDLGKRHFSIEKSDAEFTVIAKTPDPDGVSLTEGNGENGEIPPKKPAGNIFSTFFGRKRQ